MHVLVVDDDPSVRGMVRACLEHLEVLEAADGPSALAVLCTSPVDVMLLDISMPGPDGWEILRRVRGDRAYGRPAVVMLTGRPGEADRAEAFRLGADAYLTKPVEPEDLERTVEEVAGRSADERDRVRRTELGMAEFLDRLDQGFGI